MQGVEPPATVSHAEVDSAQPVLGAAAPLGASWPQPHEES